MTGFAVYSTEYDPQRLYSQGDAVAVDTGLVEEVVQFGDRPLDFYVDLEQNQLLWSFKGERHTKSARTGYFVATYQGGADLFRGFEAGLRQLHDSEEWKIPYTGDPRWDIGFELWRIPSDVPGLNQDQFETLAERVSDQSVTAAIEFGMRTQRSALQVVSALSEADADCSVAVGTRGDTTALSNVDLLLVPGAERDFEPRTASAKEIIDLGSATPVSDSAIQPPRRQQLNTGSFISGISGALVLVCLGFAAYSFISPTPVQPITGLATVGGFIGAVAALASEQVMRGTRQRLGIIDAARGRLVSDSGQSLPVLASGTFLGYSFPRVMWEIGVLSGRDGFLFGSITNVPGAFLNAGVYVLGIFVVSVCILVVQQWRGTRDDYSADLFVVVAGSHVAYAVCLLIATGLAEPLWFHVIPSTTG